jgi:hypothetical protein
MMNPFMMMNPMMMGSPFGMMPPMSMFMQMPAPEVEEDTEKNILKKMLMESQESNKSLKAINFGQDKAAPIGGA